MTSAVFIRTRTLVCKARWGWGWGGLCSYSNLGGQGSPLHRVSAHISACGQTLFSVAAFYGPDINGAKLCVNVSL